jgi:hypothetical protein
MTVSAPLPASRDELPRDTAGLAVIDQQFDLVAVCLDLDDCPNLGDA